MNTEELKQHIATTDESAFELLSDVMPNASSRFYRITNNLAKLLDEVREYYPDALYYTTGGDGFGLVLGKTHSGKSDSPNNELLAISATKLTVMGGDW